MLHEPHPYSIDVFSLSLACLWTLAFSGALRTVLLEKLEKSTLGLACHCIAVIHFYVVMKVCFERIMFTVYKNENCFDHTPSHNRWAGQ